MNNKIFLQNTLRIAAEEVVATTSPSLTHPAEKLLYELQIHQIELEMQNEELRRVQEALDCERSRYFDLYDMAPVGYITLSDMGLILQANFTSCTLLGVTRGELIKQPISRFMLRDHADIFYLLRKQILASAQPQSRELQMLKSDKTPFWVHLAGSTAPGADGVVELRIVLHDITEQKQAEMELRIAAVAFECQEGIIVMDSNREILRVNQAFTTITGYTQPAIRGQTSAMLRSNRQPPDFYAQVWREANISGTWAGEMWLRHQDGHDFFAQFVITTVQDKHSLLTHYVINLTDSTQKQQQEQQRLRNEAAHRDILVREVHHRIKNNLQGITGLLRQFVQKHPGTADPINLAISQVQSISVIYGLQGSTNATSVRLDELTQAIAVQIQALWQTPITVDTPPDWPPCVIAEMEAVPIALILNELMVNAVKHGGKSHDGVHILLQRGLLPEDVSIKMINLGQLTHEGQRTGASHSGLQLISALMPRSNAHLVMTQEGERVLTLLQLEYPVIFTLKDPR